jgi:o-succinylbenzoate---CoA ligase
MSHPVFFECGRFGSHPALAAAESSLTYSRLCGHWAALAEGLPQSKGRPMATRAPTSSRHAEMLLAILAGGGVIAPISLRLPWDQALKRAALAGAATLWDGTQWHAVPEPGDPPPARGAGTVLFSSGSAGIPKAIHHSLDAHLSSASAARKVVALNPGDRWHVTLPFWHVSGLAILLRCLQAGATAWFSDHPQSDFTPAGAGITHLSMVAVQLARFLESPQASRSLRAILLGGGPVPGSLLSAAASNGLPVHVSYGMTEAASQIATTPRMQAPTAEPHAGKTLECWQLRLSPSGEIQIAGEPIAAAVRTTDAPWHAPTDADGWFHTGDIGTTTPDGNLQVLGRADRMFVSGGENIHPEAIEAALAQMPGIIRCAVIGRAHPTFGSRPVAFLHGEWIETEVRSFLAARMESFAIPDAFLPWPEHIDLDIAKIPYREMEGVF